MKVNMIKQISQNFTTMQVFACITFTIIMSGCATPPPPPPPVVIVKEAPPVIVVEPTLPPPLNIPARPAQTRMNETLVEGAADHAVLMQAISTAYAYTLTTPEQLNNMMDALSQVYSPGFGPSLLGYGALIGAQNTDFVEGVLETARYQGIDTVIYQLYSDPTYASSFPGASFAAADIQNAWVSDIDLIKSAGARVKQQSYDAQTQPTWKKMLTDDRMERIYTISQSKTVRFTPPPPQTRLSIAETGTLRAFDTEASRKRLQFWQTYGRASAPQNFGNTAQINNPVNQKAVTLAALEILGASGEQSRTWIDGYSFESKLNQCTTIARLNVEQCLAAGHFKYEDAFCIAQHELTDISNCMTQSLL